MNILIISPSWVGDMMMSHALYQQLKTNYPHCTIDVIAPDWCRPLLSRMPEVNNAISMPIGHGEFALYKRYHLAKNLQNQYDLAIVLPNSFKSAFIPLFANIPARRGWKGEMRYGLLNDLRNNKHEYPMMVQRYVALAFDKENIPNADNLPIPKPHLLTSAEQIAQTAANFSLQSTAPLIGFCPGAEFGPAKRYPHYHFATLAKMLIAQGKQIALFGSPKDVEAGEQIRGLLNKEEQTYCINLAGKTSLEQAIDLIAHCQAIISNDSGLMHIAAALNKPLVALYGPTSPNYTPPLSDNAVIIRKIKGDLIKIRKSNQPNGYHQSLIDLNPNDVLEKLNGLLQA